MLGNSPTEYIDHDELRPWRRGILRPRQNRVACWAILLFGVIMLGMTIETGMWEYVIALFITEIAFGGLIYAVLWRPHLRAHPSYLLVGGVFRDVRISWDDLAGIELSSPKILILALESGRKVYCWGIIRRSISAMDYVEAVIAFQKDHLQSQLSAPAPKETTRNCLAVWNTALFAVCLVLTILLVMHYRQYAN